MTWLTKTFSSTIGLKILMALTGLAMVGFLVGHLSGNLLVFAGPDAINAYAETLRDFPAVLWGLRIIMIVAIAVHIYSAKTLTRRNRTSNPTKYAVQENLAATLTSRTMLPSGVFIFIYVVYHLVHLTFRLTHPEFDMLGPFDAYSMLVISFNSWWLSAFYIVAMVALGFHLAHGFRSAFQTLGINHLKYQKLITASGPMVSIAISLGFISIPVAIILGIIR